MAEIEKLEYPEIVRRRPGMFIGSLSSPKVILREVIDNSIDELYRSPQTNWISIYADQGKYTIQDNGRGIPINWKEDYECTATELAVANLYAGSNFSKTEESQTVGMNGVGVSCTNALSNKFVVLSKITPKNFDKSIPSVKDAWNSRKTERGNLFYRIVFKRGIKQIEDVVNVREVAEDYFIKYNERANTIVHFIPDTDIFESDKAELPLENLMYLGVIMEKYYKRKVNLEVNGHEFSGAFSPYKYEVHQKINLFNSEEEYNLAFAKSQEVNKPINKSIWIYSTFEFDEDINNSTDNGSVNSLTVNVGSHLWSTKTAIEVSLKEIFNTESPNLLKGLHIKTILVCAETIFDAQTKTRLAEIPGINSYQLAAKLVPVMKNVIKKNRLHFQDHVSKIDSFNVMNKQLSATRFVKQVIRSAAGTKFNASNIRKLKDASSTNRKECELFLVEGNSAGSTMVDSRDPRIHGILPLKGRPLNTMAMSTEEMLRNDEMKDIILSIGTGVNEMSNLKMCRYDKIICAADADPDGGVITASLLAFFAQHNTELIRAGKVFVVLSPLFIQSGKYIYPGEEEKLDKNKPFRRIKGLGELKNTDAYNVFFNPDTRRLVQVTLDGAEKAIKMVDKHDSTLRRELMIEIGVITPLSASLDTDVFDNEQLED